MKTDLGSFIKQDSVFVYEHPRSYASKDNQIEVKIMMNSNDYMNVHKCDVGDVVHRLSEAYEKTVMSKSVAPQVL